MYDDLVKWLRERSAWINFPHHGEEYPTEDAKLMMDAADAIETMCEMVAIAHNELANVIQSYEESKPRWISVTERLPNEKVWVLVFIHEENKAFIAVSMRTDFNYWSGLGRDRNITHWMPLPEPPEEETCTAPTNTNA